ncbi:MAG TPA: carbohydrate ABC transporter permease, partial [Phototrophicaceae bacterium]|nr:carbohydrate ABC transporter permease [Phototrophicaceae bacterium]
MTATLRRHDWVQYVALVILALLLIIMLFPFVIVIINAFKTPAEYANNGPLSLPQGIYLNGLIDFWNRVDFTNKLLNSTVISFSVAVLGVLLSLLNAFALGIGRVKGRVILLILFLMANTLPQEALAYPLYYFAKFFGIYNNHLSVILVMAVIQSAFGTYLLSSVLASFPREIVEAAISDGCSKVQLLFRIVMPISLPSLSVLFVFFFIWTWNEFFLPMVLLVSTSKQTVPQAIAILQGQHNMDATTSSASALLGLLP